MLTKVGVFNAAVNASLTTDLNIDIGGRGGVTLTSPCRMGVFNADTGMGSRGASCPVPGARCLG